MSKEVAEAAVFMLSQPMNRSVKALDVQATCTFSMVMSFSRLLLITFLMFLTAQRSLAVFDRTWNERNGI